MISADVLVAVVVSMIVITFASTIAARVGVAGPLILVGIGVVISLLPMTPPLSVRPELILVGVLPPLLYSAAASAPAIEFRRDLRAISGLAVVLVILSAIALGLFFSWAIPGLGLPLGIALGAILSPTDAVATTIVQKLGVPRRVVTLLQGESLLNDASALVILRTALAATAAGFSVGTTIVAFIWAVFSAIIVGGLVGALALRLRSWIGSATASTALGLTVPFLAYLPTNALGGSGLVAAVVAGVVSGQGAAGWLSPEQRISDKLNWRTVEFVLEGAVFLIMGLELYGIVQSDRAANGTLLAGFWIAAAAFAIVLVIRGAYVVPMIAFHARRVKRHVQRRIDARTSAADVLSRDSADVASNPADHPFEAVESARLRMPRRQVGHMRADLEYFDASPLTWKHSVIIIWAGMRGVVTLAAAQTFPQDTPERDLLVFIAFLVAVGSLLLQGLTLPALARVLGLQREGATRLPRGELRVVNRELRTSAQLAVAARTLPRASNSPFSEREYMRARPLLAAALDLEDGDGTPEQLEFELALISVMRARLRELGRSGGFSTPVLRYVLDELDANEISVRLRLESEA